MYQLYINLSNCRWPAHTTTKMFCFYTYHLTFIQWLSSYVCSKWSQIVNICFTEHFCLTIKTSDCLPNFFSFLFDSWTILFIRSLLFAVFDTYRNANFSKHGSSHQRIATINWDINHSGLPSKYTCILFTIKQPIVCTKNILLWTIYLCV